MPGDRFPVPRPRKGGKWQRPRRKGDQVSTSSFNHAELRETVAHLDVETEERGNVGHGCPAYRPGDVARSLLGVRLT